MKKNIENKNTGMDTPETITEIEAEATKTTFAGRPKKVKPPINKPVAIWELYSVEMHFKNRICGSVPLAKEMIKPWLESRRPTKPPEYARSIDEIVTEVAETVSVEEEMEKTTLGFQKDEKGLFIRGGNIRAHLKDAALQMSKVLDIQALKAKVANRVFVDDYRIYLEKDGKIVTESDGTYEQPVHVWTPQGQRSALKKIHYVEKPVMRFTLMILAVDEEVDLDIMTYLFKYGQVHGFSGERSLSEGKYDFIIRKKSNIGEAI